MQFGLALWIVALVLTIAGLVFALRERPAISSVLIASGLTLGLVSATHLDQ